MSTRLVDVQRYHWLRKLLRKQSVRPKLPDSSAAPKGLGTRCSVESQATQAHFFDISVRWRNCFFACERFGGGIERAAAPGFFLKLS